MTDAATALRDILTTVDRPLPGADAYEIVGQDPVLPTHFRIGTAASAALAAVGLAAADIWETRTGKRQKVTVDTRTAALVMRSERYLRIDGNEPQDPWAEISGVYRTGDGRWIQLHCNFPHHAAGVLEVLGCPESKAAVAEAPWMSNRGGRWLSTPPFGIKARLTLARVMAVPTYRIGAQRLSASRPD